MLEVRHIQPHSRLSLLLPLLLPLLVALLVADGVTVTATLTPTLPLDVIPPATTSQTVSRLLPRKAELL